MSVGNHAGHRMLDGAASLLSVAVSPLSVRTAGHPAKAALVLLTALFLSWTSAGTADAQQAAATNTCVSCHAGLDDEDMSLPVAEWLRSAHRPADISCQDCHGGNPATMVEDEAHDVERDFVGLPDPYVVHELCGECHQVQMENYVPSPHGLEGDFWPNCVDCHDNHEVVFPQASLISIPDNCEDCHEQVIMDDFIALTDRGLGPVDSFRLAAEEIRSAGVPVDAILGQATLARDAYIQQASHVFVLEEMVAVVDSLEQIYPRIQKEVDAARTEVDTRRRFGWMFIGLFLVLAGVVWLYRRSLPEA